MGYYANGSGNVELRDSEFKEIVKNVLSDTFETFTSGSPNDLTVSVFIDDKYYKDSVLETLEKIAPYISEGEIEYHGEDEAAWRFVFTQETKQWEEIQG